MLGAGMPVRGLVPIVGWKDGARICRVVDEAYQDMQRGMHWPWLSEHSFVTIEAYQMFFVYLDPAGKPTTNICIDNMNSYIKWRPAEKDYRPDPQWWKFRPFPYVIRELNLWKDLEMHYSCKTVPEMDQWKRWIWFLYVYLGFPTDPEFTIHSKNQCIPVFAALGLPHRNTDVSQAVYTDQDFKIALAKALEGGRFEYSRITHALRELSRIIQEHTHPIVYESIGKTMDTHQVYDISLYPIVRVFVPHKMEIEGASQTNEPRGTWFLSSRNHLDDEYFRSPKYDTFWDLFENHIWIEDTEQAFDAWLARNTDAGIEVLDPDLLDAWDMLLDDPVPLLDNEMMTKFAKAWEATWTQ